MRKTAINRGARGAMAAIVLAGAATVATAAPAAAAGCEESTYRDYTLSSQGWDVVNAYESFNPGTAGSFEVTTTTGSSRTSSVSASVGAGISTVLVEINSEVSADFQSSVSFSVGQTRAVTVPSKPYVQVARWGTYKARYYVVNYRITPTCARVQSGSGYADVYRSAVGLEAA